MKYLLHADFPDCRSIQRLLLFELMFENRDVRSLTFGTQGVLFLNSYEQDRASGEIVDNREERERERDHRLTTNFISFHGRVPLEFVSR